MKKILAVVVLLTLAVAGGVYGLSTEKSVPDGVVVLYTQGMTCGSCAAKIDAALKKIDGVAAVETAVDRGRVFASFDSKKVQAGKVAETVSGIGYQSSIAAVMPVEQFRSMAGRDLGQVQGPGSGCACCSKK